MYITTPGIVQMDLLKVIQRDHNLVSYKQTLLLKTLLMIKLRLFRKLDKKNTTLLKIEGSNTLYPGNFYYN